MKEIGTKTIETERLKLRKFAVSDAQQMYENWATDHLTCAHLSWNVHENIDVTKSFIEAQITNYKDPYFFHWVVERKFDHKLIGAISVVKFGKQDEICEIGYNYGSRFWNQGYATEALRAVIDFLLKEVGISLVTANHISSNPASGKVMQKVGMRHDATLRSRRIDKATDQRVDLCMYSITRDEL